MAPARDSESANAKAEPKVVDDEHRADDVAALMAEMAAIVRNTCGTPSADADVPTFDVLTAATTHQQRAS